MDSDTTVAQMYARRAFLPSEHAQIGWRGEKIMYKGGRADQPDMPLHAQLDRTTGRSRLPAL